MSGFEYKELSWQIGEQPHPELTVDTPNNLIPELTVDTPSITVGLP
jgi:hypothetical protein